ncbi:MAG: patatin-like phospholipase family protein [Desulfobacterales bacterium]|nr:patatin-like phospholipase family protein [Desulfobacterales bacterium]
MKKIGLALGSGGAKGLAHIAFIKALDELGVKPSIISGTSIGAIVGAFYASGISGLEMEDIIKNLRFKDIGKMLDVSLFKGRGLIKGKGVINFFKKYLRFKNFEDLEIPLKVVAADFWNRKEFIFEEGSLIFALRASMSLPVIFEPVKMTNTILIDGGSINPLPYDLIRNDCDILIAIDVSGEKVSSNNNPMPSMFDNIMNTFQIMQCSIVNNKKCYFKPDLYIKPELTNYRMLEFYRYEEILLDAKKYADFFKTELTQLLEKL